jgi:single-strand DNA-binding protein
MPNLNKVFLMGNLTRDPELRYTSTGLAVAQFGLAVNRKYTSKDGEQKDEVCFVDIQAFGRQAETLSQYTSKGRPLFVEGRLRLDTWQGQDGQKRSKLQVVLEGFQFIGGRPPQGGEEQAPKAPEDESQVPPESPPEAPPQAPPDVKKDNIPF